MERFMQSFLPLSRRSLGFAGIALAGVLLASSGPNSAAALPMQPLAGVDVTPDVSLVRLRGGKRARGLRGKRGGAWRHGRDDHANNHQNHHNPDQVGSPGDSRPTHTNDDKPTGGNNDGSKNNGPKNNGPKNNGPKNNGPKNTDGRPTSLPGGLPGGVGK